MPQIETMLGGASTQGLHDGREEKLLQNLRCRADQRDRVVGTVFFAGLPCFQNWDDDGVLPNCRNVN